MSWLLEADVDAPERLYHIAHTCWPKDPADREFEDERVTDDYARVVPVGVCGQSPPGELQEPEG